MSNLPKKRCLLKSVGEMHPYIEILDTDTFVGRTRETQIADTLVSKKHLKLRADFDKKCVIIEILGLNPSTLNGTVIENNSQHKAFHNDVIEILPSKYKYKVHFEIKVSKETKVDETIGQKRKRSMDDSHTSLPSSKRVKWEIDVVLDEKNHTPGAPWETYNNGQILVYTPPNCKPSNKIASYDMDGTLITTKSGKVFAQNVDDWKLAYGTVATILKAEHNDGFKVVIFTNQAGITSGKTKIPDIKKKIENVMKTLNVPVQAFIATGENQFRKPSPGMWQALCKFKNDDVQIDLDQSYFVGDAAGRPENKAMKKKKDHSTVDRLMALNIGLAFFTPEEHFLKVPCQSWVKPEFIPKEFLSRSINLINDPNQKIVSNDLEVILMVGGPETGKSQFCKEHLEPYNYEVVSRDKIGTWQKCVDRVNDCLKTRRKVVVDNTNGDTESRPRYINAAKKHKVPCRAFVMTTSLKHAEHNIIFRELTNTKHSKISKIVLNSYKKNFQEPSTEEGFTEIVRVNFVPDFKDERERALYEMYLLAS